MDWLEEAGAVGVGVLYVSVMAYWGFVLGWGSVSVMS